MTETELEVQLSEEQVGYLADGEAVTTLASDGETEVRVTSLAPTREQELFSDLYSHLDETGSTLNALANAIHAAGEAGHQTETLDDIRADIDNGVQQAFEEMGSDDPDPSEVLDWVDTAESASAKLLRAMDHDAKTFELPDHVDSGVYDTLGGYAEYVHKDMYRVNDVAEEWWAHADD